MKDITFRCRIIRIVAHEDIACLGHVTSVVSLVRNLGRRNDDQVKWILVEVEVNRVSNSRGIFDMAGNQTR